MPATLHRHDQPRDPGLLLHVRVRADEHLAVVGDVPEAGPDLLAVDDVLVAVGTARVRRLARSEPRSVRRTLAPHLLARSMAGRWRPSARPNPPRSVWGPRATARQLQPTYGARAFGLLDVDEVFGGRVRRQYSFGQLIPAYPASKSVRCQPVSYSRRASQSSWSGSGGNAGTTSRQRAAPAEPLLLGVPEVHAARSVPPAEPASIRRRARSLTPVLVGQVENCWRSSRFRTLPLGLRQRVDQLELLRPLGA
jgi:hypothetical protein